MNIITTILFLHLTIPSSSYQHKINKPIKTNLLLDRRKLISLTSLTPLFLTIPANAETFSKQRGILLPDPGEIQNSIPNTWDDDSFPFQSNQFARLDQTSDSIFYSTPRFVEHVDEACVQLLETNIQNFIGSKNQVLDLCSSWTSHISPKVKEGMGLSISGLGMNEEELKANVVLDDWTVQDLNTNTKLPYGDASFDKVLCQLSIDYLIHPVDVLKEVGRVLKPGGKVAIFFSNRLFLSKVRCILLVIHVS